MFDQNHVTLLFYLHYLVTLTDLTAMAGKNDTEIGEFDFAKLDGIPAAVKDLTAPFCQLADIVLKANTAIDEFESKAVTICEEYTGAIAGIREAAELVYQFINKIDYVTYRFRMAEFKSDVKNMKSEKHRKQLQNTLSKATQMMSDAQEMYTNLQKMCQKIATDCSKNEQFCHTKASEARRRNITMWGAGTLMVAGTVVFTVGVGAVVVGVATFSIRTIVSIGIAAVLSASAVRIGIDEAAVPVKSDYKKDEKMFKDLSLLFKDVGESGLKLHSFILKAWTAFQETQLFAQGIQVSDCKKHEISRCQDELLRLHEVAIEMYKITSSIKEKMKCEESKFAENVSELPAHATD